MHIDIHLNAAEDLRQMRRTAPRAVAAILAALQQMEADPRLEEKLKMHGDSVFGTARVGVKQWQAVKGAADLWRFRVFDTPATVYRVIYGFHSQTRQVCILAVVHKEEFDYEPDSNIGKRILADWQSI